MSDYRLNDWGFDPWQRQKSFPLDSVSRLALRPMYPPIQLVLGVLYLGLKCLKLTTT